MHGLEKKPLCARGLTMPLGQRKNEREIRKAAVALTKWTGPRAAIENLLRRDRKMSARRRRRMVRSLIWSQPGAVWAMDSMQAPAPVDGRYPRILAVRDLASGMMLQALPVEHASAWTTARALEARFRQHGAPLVLKSDNGGHVKGWEVAEVLRAHGVLALLTPVALPEHHGAMEAGIGSLATRAHHHGARHGRPGHWTCDDVEGARREANATRRSRTLVGSTPNEAWASRSSLTPEDRATFTTVKARMDEVVRLEQGYFLSLELDEKTQGALERMAVVHSLMECGYLHIRRSRIPLPQRTVVCA